MLTDHWRAVGVVLADPPDQHEDNHESTQAPADRPRPTLTLSDLATADGLVSVDVGHYLVNVLVLRAVLPR